MNDLTQKVARRIIETVGAHGTPPEYGVQYFTSGLDGYLQTIEEEYLDGYIKDGGAVFKLVVGIYGGGKTHFLYCTRDLAWKHGFCVSYVMLKSGESPFYSLDKVYKAIATGLMAPSTADELLSGCEKGLPSFMRSWYAQKRREYLELGLAGEDLRNEILGFIDGIEGLESISFTNAIKHAIRALLDGNEDNFLHICQWLLGEGFERKRHARFGILQRIDKSTAFSMIRSLAQLLTRLEYAGVLILLDEAERMASLSSKNREQHLNNLRELIDECGQTGFQNILILYAVPNENFLDGRTQVYEALRQRLETHFDDRVNYTGVKIELEKVVGEAEPFLQDVGNKLAKVYQIAYQCQFSKEDLDKLIHELARSSYERKFMDIGYKRLFVQELVKALHIYRKGGAPPTPATME